MSKKEVTARETGAFLIGAALMLAAIVVAQFLDRDEKARDAVRLKSESAVQGFNEGMNRIQCMGGIRYDTATGLAIDIDDQFHVKQHHE